MASARRAVKRLKRSPLPPMDEFTLAYIEAALWSSTDDADEPLDKRRNAAHIDRDTLDCMIADCAAFQAANAAWISYDYLLKADTDPNVQAGHDFWLTRCGHGAGFWDGDWSDEADAAMTAYSSKAGNVDLYVGDAGRIHAL